MSTHPSRSAAAEDNILLLDRDGVLNALVVDVEHGTIDSPLHPDQVQVFPGVPETLQRLHAAGYFLHIVTNQPAFAKGKTTLANLQAVHALVVAACESQGAKIASSHLCLHRAEDHCVCRKPKPGMLQTALSTHAALGEVWMVGDGMTDIQAGQALKLNTCFIGPRKCDICRVLRDQVGEPTLWCKDLAEFAERLLHHDDPV